MCGNTRSFVLGAIVGVALFATIPMNDPVIRSRMGRCARKMVRRVKSGITDLM